MKDFDLDFDKL